jgi:hypothetical protein
MENMEISKEIKNRTIPDSVIPLLSMCPKEMKYHILKNLVYVSYRTTQNNHDMKTT